MEMILIFLSLIIQQVFTQYDYTQNGDPAEFSNYMNSANDLYNELFTKRIYHKNLSPVYGKIPANGTRSPVKAMNVDLVLYYFRLLTLDAESQILSASVEIIMSWRDPRLAWNNTIFGEIDRIFLTSDIIWTPDNQIGNSKSMTSVHPDGLAPLTVYSNGTVVYPLIWYAEVGCNINVNRFPFDQQQLYLSILSFAYKTDLMTMTGKTKLDKNRLMGNGEWNIVDIDTASFVNDDADVVSVDDSAIMGFFLGTFIRLTGK
ncbi:unnamed protein product, partial [Mesorhabditis belari]|uniref:Neurotransmitter-gated ion-channel ligand-binding domain-containing protein n=1 Tax=Mesorhabditis belari TaxID=2138241 RepID=A0AAF3F6R9_9BILA